MRVPRTSFTIRQLVVAVAGLGLVFGGIVETRRRRERFLTLAGYHWRKYPGRFGNCFGVPTRFSPHSEWHREMSEKYTLAYRSPWLPVASDPPPPLDRCPCSPQSSATLTDLMREFLEREGWDTHCGETIEGRFSASCNRGEGHEEIIVAEGASEDEAWGKMFARARELGVRLPNEAQ
jgi:hypothetical protein